MNSPEQSDKVAVITGGASGIGAAIARGLGSQRMRVVIADIDTQASARTVAELVATRIEATAVTIDVTSAGSIAAAFDEVQRAHGRCDVLVNCAGIAKTYPFLEFPLDNWQRTLDVNLTGALRQVDARRFARSRPGNVR